MVKRAGAKRRKAEKAKTQLKKSGGVGKKSLKLTKGLNCTDAIANAVIISKGLKLTTQFKHEFTGSSSSEPLTKKRQSLKDCIIKLSHHGKVNRLDALEGIFELIEQFPEIIHEHLSILLSKTAPLSYDEESELRKKAIWLLREILSRVSELRLEPLYSILTAHLSVSLSHIDKGIQRDALLWLDDLLAIIPNFIVANHDILLPNCLDQISRNNDMGVRSLTSFVHSQCSLNEWTTLVLKRLKNILTHLQRSEKISETQKTVFLVFKDEKSRDYDYFSSPLSSKVSLDPISFSSLSKSSLETRNETKSISSFSLHEFLSSLTSLLSQLWSQVILTEKEGHFTSSDFLIAPERINVMGILSEILLIIVFLLKDSLVWKDFSSTNRDFLTKTIMTHFPYSHGVGRKGLLEKLDYSMEKINIVISCIYVETLANSSTNSLSSSGFNTVYLDSIIDYGHNLCESPEIFSDSYFISLLRALSFVSISNEYDSLLKKSLASKPNSRGLLTHFQSLALENSSLSSVKDWISRLPLSLASSNVSEIELESMAFLQRTQNEFYLDSFCKNASKILNDISKTIYPNTQIFSSVIKTITIFFYGQKQSNATLMGILKEMNDISSDIRKLCINLMTSF